MSVLRDRRAKLGGSGTCTTGENMGTDRSVHWRRGTECLAEMVAPWDREVSPQVFGLLRHGELLCVDGAKTWGQTALSTGDGEASALAEAVAPWDRVVSPHVFGLSRHGELLYVDGAKTWGQTALSTGDGELGALAEAVAPWDREVQPP